MTLNRLALLAFRETYNTTWLIQRLDYRPPAQIRQQQLPAVAIAAQAAHGCLINRRRYTLAPSSSLLATLRQQPEGCQIGLWHER